MIHLCLIKTLHTMRSNASSKVIQGESIMEATQISFDSNRALPAEAYRDPMWLEAERKEIWHNDWVFATSIDALANPGDQVPTYVGSQPVLLIRRQSGELAALSNLCAHRGTLLVDKPTNSNRIQCPYHGWTYEDSGHLRAIPYATEDKIDKAAHCLPVYRVETWHGLVFVSLNSDVEPLTERFADIDPLVTERGIDDMRHDATFQTTDEWACNWKVAILNAMESYHLFKVHPSTLEPFAPTKASYYITGSPKATATGGSYKDGEDYLLISLPPGFVGIFSQGTFLWQSVHPIDTHRCEVRTGGAFKSKDSSNLMGHLKTWFNWSAGAMLPGDFLAEDKEICQRVQLGISGEFVPGQLLKIEEVVIDFGRYLYQRLTEGAPSQPTSVKEL